MDLGDVEACYNIVLCGSSGVGKTSLVTRFCRGECPSKYKQTVGVGYYEKSIAEEPLEQEAKLMISDLGGAQSVMGLALKYLEKAAAVVLVFSTIDRESFNAVRSFYSTASKCGVERFVLVQNKMDMLEETKVTKDEAEALARELSVKLYRTCATTNLNVSPVFHYLATICSNEPLDESYSATTNDIWLEDGEPIGLVHLPDSYWSYFNSTFSQTYDTAAEGSIFAQDGAKHSHHTIHPQGPSKIRTERKKRRCELM